MVAIYEVENRRAELFFSTFNGEAEALDAVESFRVHLSQWGAVGEDVVSTGDGGFRCRESVLGEGAVVTIGPHLAGVFGDLDTERADAILGELVESLAEAGG